MKSSIIFTLFLLAVLSFPAVGQSISVVNAASNQHALAPGAIGVVYGARLADTVAQSSALPLPTMLGGVSVQIGTGNTAKYAPLFYVSPTQINFLVPDGLAGLQDLFVFKGLDVHIGSVFIDRHAPGIFTWGSFAAQHTIRDEDNVYLVLFGTGITLPDENTAQMVYLYLDNGKYYRAQYVGPCANLAGLVQLNIKIPAEDLTINRGAVLYLGHAVPGALCFAPECFRYRSNGFVVRPNHQ